MKGYGSVLLLAASILIATALPNSMESVDTGSMMSEEAACTQTFNQAQQNTNQQVTQQTQACLQMTAPVDPMNPQTLAQVATVRSNLTSLQTNLANCLAINDNFDFVSCVANDNDVNQHLLNNANENAQNAEGQLNNSSEQTTSDQKNCVSHVLSKAKTNLTNAANNYNKCLEAVLNNPILQ